jgi:HAE1 family hydrophobic/amphiphilic exporter-1
MQRIVRWCLGNKSVVILATLLLIGSGAYATTQLNQELLPDISFPIITISTPVAGAGPDLVDEQVTQPVEDAIDGVQGIQSVRSTSSQGFSVVLVEFDLDQDTEEAESDLQAALDGVSLPSQAGDPEVESQSASQFPILSLSLAAEDGDLADLTAYAEDDVVPSLEEVEGVSSVDLIGGAEKQIKVDLDPGKLKDKDLTTDAVVGAISGAEVDAPVGSVSVDGRETPVSATSDLGGIKALEDLPVGVEGATTGSRPGPRVALLPGPLRRRRGAYRAASHRTRPVLPPHRAALLPERWQALLLVAPRPALWRRRLSRCCSGMWRR